MLLRRHSPEDYRHIPASAILHIPVSTTDGSVDFSAVPGFVEKIKNGES